MIEDDGDLFRARLTETIAWCTRPGEDGSLRSPALQPPPRVDVAAIDAEMVRLVAERRQGLIAASAHALAAGVHGGRLLLFDPEGSLGDGAAELSSGGFFDSDNAPPWDTWICLTRDDERTRIRNQQLTDSAGRGSWNPIGFVSFLVSWVPPEFISRTDAGIWANPEGCIAWANEVESALLRFVPSGGYA